MQGILEKANKSESLITTLAIRKPAEEVKKCDRKVLVEEDYIEVTTDKGLPANTQMANLNNLYVFPNFIS